MKAIQVVGYHEDLKAADVEEPKINGPLDVIVKIGAAGEYTDGQDTACVLDNV